MIKDLGPGDPASVGPYRLVGRLGAGGMGQVYLAKSPGGRLVAIKLIRPELAEERGFRSRFSSEISAAKNVSGIYTAAVVDADADAEHPWMATVYVAGPSLADAVEDNGPLPVKSVLALAAGLAEALQAIHRVGVVHRDLKPSNVLLAEDGPRVIDFGISLALERSMMTATGMVMGSPGFMSPEQARGQREVGAPTDVFSLGAVLAFAATGNNPFGGGPTPALLYRVVNETPDLASVPAPLTSLIGDCLAKDPAARPTPADLLERLSGDVGVLTGGEWLPAPITETMKRYTPTTVSGVPGAIGYEPTALAPSIPPPAVADSVAATRVERNGLPGTVFAPQPGAVTAGRGTPGGTGGSPPAGPPSRRRWLWLAAAAAAAAAAIVVAVVAVLLTSHSNGGPAKPSVTRSGSLLGKTHPPSRTPTRHPTATAAVVAPSTQPAPATSGTSPTATYSPTATATPTATTAPTTTAPTPTSTTTTVPTQSPTSNPATAPAQSPTP